MRADTERSHKQILNMPFGSSATVSELEKGFLWALCVRGVTQLSVCDSSSITFITVTIKRWKCENDFMETNCNTEEHGFRPEELIK